MKIALIYNKENEFTTGAYIEKVIKNAGIEYAHFWTQSSCDIPKEFDLYFRIDHGDYKYDIPADLHPSAFYAIDTHLKKPYKKIKSQAKHYDIVFCAQKDGADRLKRELKIDTKWIPLGCDPDVHKKLGMSKIYDIGFVGRDAKKFARGKQLELLKKKYPNSFIGGADFRKMSEIYSSSRIGFNSSILNDINMRVFEVMACGALLLTNKIKGNGFDELFTDKKDLVAYKNNKEMLELIEHYLKNEKERYRIADNGYQLVIKKHAYFHRVQSMLNYIALKLGLKFESSNI
ncbi:MAG: glycosyltransferase [Candidatus Omnitrophota bacterium]|nr:glycosyltransferase [Candidatus Omnitrophota bacterium]